MFADASLRTWGGPGGCGLGFDLRARTRTGMCPNRQSWSAVRSDHSALCEDGIRFVDVEMKDLGSGSCGTSLLDSRGFVTSSRKR